MVSWTLPESLSSALLRYYFGPDHRMKMRLWEWVHRALGRPRFTVPFSKARLSVDLRDFIQFEIAKTGGYETEVWERLRPFVAKDEVVWDIGANIGSFAFRAACDPAVKEVHAFEPGPRVIPQLRRNAKLNREMSVAVHPIALSARNEKRVFYEGLKANEGVGSFSPRWSSHSIEVSAHRGDDWIAQGHAPAPTLIKLDVEGAELEALQGLEATLRTRPPKAIIFEAHWGPGGTLLSQPVVDFLESLDYQTPLPEPGPAGHPINLLSTPRSTAR